MKQQWKLSCLGSIGQRRKSIEGKLRAMFTRQNFGELFSFKKEGDNNEVASASAKKTSREEEGEQKTKLEDVEEQMVKDENVPTSTPRSSTRSATTTTTTTSTGRVYKRRKRNKKRARMTSMADEDQQQQKPICVREIFANAKINSRGDLTARVGKKFA